MAELTERQASIRTFILEYQAEHGRRPTYEQIGAALGIKSKHTINRYMKKLEAAGELVLVYAAKAAGREK